MQGAPRKGKRYINASAFRCAIDTSILTFDSFPMRLSHSIIPLFIFVSLPSVNAAEKRLVTEEDLDLAMISDEAYSIDPKKNINDRWVYVDESSFKNRLGLVAVRGVVYRNVTTARIAVAFRGTDPTNKVTLGADLTLNAAQLRGEYTPNLEGALLVAAQMSREHKFAAKDAIYTGHSKGGAEASFVAESFGAEAVVFNPALLHENNIRRAENNHRQNEVKELAHRASTIINLRAKDSSGKLDLISLAGKDYNARLLGESFEVPIVSDLQVDDMIGPGRLEGLDWLTRHTLKVTIESLKVQMEMQGGAITSDESLIVKWLNTDPADPKVLGVEIGMKEEEVIKVLETIKINDIKKSSGTDPSLPEQFLLQSESLVQTLDGGVSFYFDDGRRLSRIYTNAKKLAITSNTGDTAKIGDHRSAFDKCLNKKPKTGTLRSEHPVAVYEVSGVNFIVIYPKIPGTVSAWSIVDRDHSPDLVLTRE